MTMPECLICHSKSAAYDASAPDGNKYPWRRLDAPIPAGPFCSPRCLDQFASLSETEQLLVLYGRELTEVILHFRETHDTEADPEGVLDWSGMLVNTRLRAAVIAMPELRIAVDYEAANRLGFRRAES
jgi:hypothetical protein